MQPTARPAQLAYDRTGSGTPLVLLHALGTDRRMWDPVIDLLAPERDTIAIDLPGFGDSPPVAGSVAPTPRALAQAVAAFLGAHGVSRPHVAGCSLGGWVALELALAGEARSATAVAPAGLWPRPLAPSRRRVRVLGRALAPLIVVWARSRRGRQMLLANSVAHPERVPASAAAYLVRSYIAAPGYPAVNDAMRAARFEDLARIDVPVTLIWPEHDRLVSRPRDLPPGVASRTLTGAGHIPTWDAPVQLARMLLEGSAG